MKAIEGVTPRHRRGCPATGWQRCSCNPGYRAEVWDNARQRRLTKTFPTSAAAKSWRHAALTSVRRGTLGAFAPITVREAATAWLEKAQAHAIKNKSGLDYKPSVLRGYETSLTNYVIPALGSRKLSEVRTAVVQDFVDDLMARTKDEALKPSSIRNILAPLRVVFNDALRRELVATNPVVAVVLPGVGAGRDRIATPAEALKLLAALKADRPIWATAFYTGMRRGELMALDWSNVDLVAREIRVERSWDPRDRSFVATKTKSGTRTVPFPQVLVAHLAAEDRTTGLVFGGDSVTPFGATGVRKRAKAAWTKAKLEPITLHECRHTYASLMLSAGVDIWKVSKYMGHSSIQITVDRYGHLVKGSGRDDMVTFDSYLAAGSRS